MKHATINDAPPFLNTNDKAMWVLGFNAALTGAQPAAPSGYRWVPLEPTTDMIDAAEHQWHWHSCGNCAHRWKTGFQPSEVTSVYGAMLSAAPAAQPADSAMTAEQIEALAHRTAWRYVHGSSNPNDSANSEYTFNRAQLLEFARALVAKETPHAR